MKQVTLQTKNIDYKIKKKAEMVVREAGFSSLQDVIRIMISDIANGKLPVRMDWGFPRDPDVKRALEEYERGEYRVIKPDEKFSDNLK